MKNNNMKHNNKVCTPAFPPLAVDAMVSIIRQPRGPRAGTHVVGTTTDTTLKGGDSLRCACQPCQGSARRERVASLKGTVGKS
jgi:hypothetical protein